MFLMFVARCEAKVKCSKCNSDRHPMLLHKERAKKNVERRETETGNQGDGEEKHANDDDDEEVTSTQTKVGAMLDVAVSCSKIVLIDIFHPSRPNNIIRTYALIDERSNSSMISPSLKRSNHLRNIANNIPPDQTISYVPMV